MMTYLKKRKVYILKGGIKMGYESKCIRDIVLEDINKDIFLPAIQREYVWDTSMIEKFFDSIMGDYPIGSFLFWKIKEENKKDWTSYELINNFDKEVPHNKEANVSGVNKDIYLVLDGQQRLTSLLIGLKGSYSFLKVTKRKMFLYLNLLKAPLINEENPEELTYQFQFRDNDIGKDKNEKWYLVGKILDDQDAEDSKSAIDEIIKDCDDKQKLEAKKMVGRLHSRIHTYKLINYYEEKSQKYDFVVEVFVRANTGGKKLEYSDILLSMATAKWKNLNAKEEINNFTDELNSIGSGYSFDKDFVLKSSLFLTEDLPIQYKVKNFNQTNLQKIENNWEYIKDVLLQTVNLVAKFGFMNNNITSNYALLPISLYIGRAKKKNYYLSTTLEDSNIQDTIKKWLSLCLIKGSFGGSSDTTLTKVRDAIMNNENIMLFPAEDLNISLKQEATFSDMEIDNIIKTGYKTKYAYLILSLLYPDRDWKDKAYHEDHIYPKTEFEKAKIKKRGYTDDKMDQYWKWYNTILNLELLTDSENLSKSSAPFDDWICNRDKSFKKRHSIPVMEDYSFDNFLEFIDKRKATFIDKLKSLSF